MLRFWSLCIWVLDEPIQGKNSSAICICSLMEEVSIANEIECIWPVLLMSTLVKYL